MKINKRISHKVHGPGTVKAKMKGHKLWAVQFDSAPKQQQYIIHEEEVIVPVDIFIVLHLALNPPFQIAKPVKAFSTYTAAEAYVLRLRAIRAKAILLYGSRCKNMRDERLTISKADWEKEYQYATKYQAWYDSNYSIDKIELI